MKFESIFHWIWPIQNLWVLGLGQVLYQHDVKDGGLWTLHHEPKELELKTIQAHWESHPDPGETQRQVCWQAFGFQGFASLSIEAKET